jgi:hypothetical protein
VIRVYFLRRSETKDSHNQAKNGVVASVRR